MKKVIFLCFILPLSLLYAGLNSSKITVSSITISNGAGVGKILTSDASGNGTWQSLSSSTLQGAALLSSTQTFTGQNTFSNQVVISSKTGIGTLSPTEMLEVSGNIKASNGIVGSTMSISGQSLLATSSGNVGIGTVSPTQKLEVNGVIKASSFTFNGSQYVNKISTDTTLSGNLNTTIPTEKAVKTYVDINCLQSQWQNTEISLALTGTNGLDGTDPYYLKFANVVDTSGTVNGISYNANKSKITVANAGFYFVSIAYRGNDIGYKIARLEINGTTRSDFALLSYTVYGTSSVNGMIYLSANTTLAWRLDTAYVNASTDTNYWSGHFRVTRLTK